MGSSYKIIKVQPAVTAADNADNDVMFDWTELANFTNTRGMGALLQSVALMDRNDTGPGSVSFDLFFVEDQLLAMFLLLQPQLNN